MKKFLACLLALPLTLAACGVQPAQPEPTQSLEVTTEATAESGEMTPAQVNRPGITGQVRPCGTEVETAAGLYTLHELFNEAANEDVYCVVKTDIGTAAQEKLASITLDGGYYGMAVWDDAVDLYLQENTTEGERPSLRYTIDTATGNVEKQQMDGAFAPTWYDDAALYQENRSNLWVESLTRLDRATGELILQNLPGQIYTVYGAVDGRWLLVRVNSAAPVPDPTSEEDAFNATWQNSTAEIVLYDPANGEMEKLYEFSTTDESYDYCGQRGGSLYFLHYMPKEDGTDGFYLATVDKLENGAMTPVATLPFNSTNVSPMQQQGELRWITQLTEKGETSIQIFDLADGQIYTRAIEWDKVEGWNAGYPEKLLANNKILVSNGSYTNVYGIDRKAYAVMDCTAYLAGSTDYTPVTMYTGD